MMTRQVTGDYCRDRRVLEEVSSRVFLHDQVSPKGGPEYLGCSQSWIFEISAVTATYANLMNVLEDTTDAQASEFPSFRLGISLVLPKVIISLDDIA